MIIIVYMKVGLTRFTAGLHYIQHMDNQAEPAIRMCGSRQLYWCSRCRMCNIWTSPIFTTVLVIDNDYYGTIRFLKTRSFYGQFAVRFMLFLGGDRMLTIATNVTIKATLVI